MVSSLGQDFQVLMNNYVHLSSRTLPPAFPSLCFPHHLLHTAWHFLPPSAPPVSSRERENTLFFYGTTYTLYLIMEPIL